MGSYPWVVFYYWRGMQLCDSELTMSDPILSFPYSQTPTLFQHTSCQRHSSTSHIDPQRDTVMRTSMAQACELLEHTVAGQSQKNCMEQEQLKWSVLGRAPIMNVTAKPYAVIPG